jgi:hypothetical protein
VSEPPPPDDWAPTPSGDVAGQFKWGWNKENGEIVWPVAGPGDGFPSHDAFLSSAWGRAPSSSAGDRLGRAHHLAANEVETVGSALVVVESYYGDDVPGAVLEWFRREFPEALVRAASVRG